MFDEHSDPDEPPTRDVTSPSKSGVAYLTETLIRRLTKEENIAQITTLRVTLGKDLNKKIKVIKFKSCPVSSIICNHIKLQTSSSSSFSYSWNAHDSLLLQG